MHRKAQAVSILQASESSSSLARLMNLNRESKSRLQAIESLLPMSLRPGVVAGPFEAGVWCLLVANPSVLAKVRQLLPSLQAHLASQGLPVESIRLKIQKS